MTAFYYGQTFTLWRSNAPEAWHDFTRHTFVEGLRDGTLPRAAFMHYLVQDYIFLIHFARAWSLAVMKSETLYEMRICADTVSALVNQEMTLHVALCAQQGINEAALISATESTANLAYTRYVLDAGTQGDLLDLMAALAPCVMGYGEIGLRLGQDRAVDTPYFAWIETYAAPAYQNLCASVGVMIDEAVARRIGALATSPRALRLQQHFDKATELEIGFWQMGLDQS